jgi:histidine phosphotransferase ChpT
MDTAREIDISPTLDALDLAALLCSRVCHDVISPVGAITNGLEVLEDEDTEEMRAFALDLIKKSARQASAKLQFARLAFGAAGSAGAEIDLGDAEAVARGILEGDKVTLSWIGERRTMPKNLVKLLLNLLLVAVATVPRGGRVAVEITGEAAAPRFRLAASGLNARIPHGVDRLLAGGGLERPIDAHLVQLYYTRRLLEATAMRLAMTIEGETVTIDASPKAATVAA